MSNPNQLKHPNPNPLRGPLPRRPYLNIPAPLGARGSEELTVVSEYLYPSCKVLYRLGTPPLASLQVHLEIMGRGRSYVCLGVEGKSNRVLCVVRGLESTAWLMKTCSILSLAPFSLSFIQIHHPSVKKISPTSQTYLMKHISFCLFSTSLSVKDAWW